VYRVPAVSETPPLEPAPKPAAAPYPKLRAAMDAVRRGKQAEKDSAHGLGGSEVPAPLPKVAEVVGFQPAEVPDYQTAQQVPEVPDVGIPTKERNDPKAIAPYGGPPAAYKDKVYAEPVTDDFRRGVDKATYEANLSESKKKHLSRQ